MKTRKQKRKRSLARKRDRESPSLWVYMGMNHVCPNRRKPFERKYYLYDDVSKMYLSDPYNQDTQKSVTLNNMKLNLTTHKACAEKMKNFIADHNISRLKGTGKWRAIRIN